MISRIFATLPLLLLSLPALGAELTWGASGNGGSGAWNSANWFDGNTTVNWPNTGGSAVFGGLPGTVTVAGGFLVENLEFRTAGYLLDGFFLRSSSTGLTINTLADAISNVSIFSGSDPNSGIFTKKGPATLTIDSLEGFKQINILSGELRASTNIDTGEAAFSFSSDSAARLTFGDTFSTGGLQGGSVLSEIYPLDSPGTGGSGTRFLSISDIGGSFAGILRDNGASKLAVEKLSGGQQEFTASNSYSGPTTIHEGTISFAGQGSALNTALTVRAQGTLLLDNTSVAQSNRISDFAAISLGGNLILQGNSLAPVAEEAGDLIPSGHPVIQVLAASSQPATLTFRNFTPALAAATIPVFIGTRLGQTSGPGVANIRFATVPALVGGGGGNASTTLSILPGAYGGEAGPESLLTYDVSGLRPLSGNEYVHNSLTAGAFTNVTLDIPVAIAGARTVNALRMEDGSVVSGDGELTIGSGTILALSGKTRLMETILHFGPITGNLFTVGDLTIGSRITGSKGLHKSGPGTLVLAGSNSYTGKTQIIAGTVRLENDLALGNTLEGTILTTGAALELIGGLSIGSEPLILSGNGPQGRGALRGLGGENSWAGDITALADDTVIGVETGSLTLSGKFEGPSLIKTGSGLLSVNGDNSLLTRITLSGGTLRSHGQPDTNPVIGTEVQLNRGRLEIAPAGAGADVSLQLSNNDSLSYSGNAILMLDRGEHSSLSVTIGSTDVGENVFRLNTGTLVIVPASGQLGTVEKLKEE
ncbi:MAG: autotransporter-associated beta strand repeat-containing protein, partial [Verrucomicrobiota bacterium]